VALLAELFDPGITGEPLPADAWQRVEAGIGGAAR
jgi:hypothetical protein